MKVELHPNFKKSYKRRIANNRKLVAKTAEKLRLFQNDSNNPILEAHPLKGEKKDYRAFSVTGNIRIIYFPVSGNHVILVDIGSHPQVY